METMSLLSVKSLSDGGGGGGGDITKSEVISRDNNVLQSAKAYTDEKTPKDYIEKVEKDTENQQIKLTDNKGNETSFSYGGGSGTSDYEALLNLPKINNITLTGNKSGVDIGVSRLVEVEENQTIHGYSVPKLTAENITTIHNSVVAGIPTFVTDATGEYTYLVKQSDSGSDEIYVVLDFCDVMTLTYILSGDTVETDYAEFTPEYYLFSISKNEETKTITITDNQGNETSFSYDTAIDEKPFWYLNKRLNYLYEIGYQELDYAYAKDFFQKYKPVTAPACSSIAKNGILARNYDWLYNEEVTFIVQTPHTLTRYASFGVASGLSELTREFVESGEVSDAYKVLPFFMNDGVNEHGLCVSTNVTPDEKGDNSHITPTGTVDDTICTLMLPRYILDNFRSAEEAVSYLTEHVALYTPNALLEMGYNQHFIITDGAKTYVIELNDGAYVVRDDINYLTNFYAADVTFNEDGTVYTPADVPNGNKPSDNGITAHGQGLERWNIIASNYDELAMDIGEIKSLLKSLMYTNTYASSTSPADPFWYSECLTATVDNNNPPSAFDDIVDSMAEAYTGRTRDGSTWESVHSAIYDFKNGKFYVCSEEDTSAWITYDLWNTGATSYNDLENKPQINGVTLEGNIADIEELGGLRKRGAGTAHRAYTVLSDGSNNMRDITWEPIARNLVKWTNQGTLQSNDPIADLDVINKQTLDSEMIKKLNVAWGEENAGKLLIVNSEGNIALRDNDENVAISYWNLPLQITYSGSSYSINAEVIEYAVAENEYVYTMKFSHKAQNVNITVSKRGEVYETPYVMAVTCEEQDFAFAMCNNVVLSVNEDNQWVIGKTNEPSTNNLLVAFGIAKATEGNVENFSINGYGQVASNTRLLENGTPIVKALNVEMGSGGSAVDSVNGRTGDVILTKNDVGLNDVDNTSDDTKKANFKGEIAPDDNGFTSGSDVYNALQEKQDNIDEYLVSIKRNDYTKYITITDSTGLETQFPYEGITDYEQLESLPQIGGTTLIGNKDIEEFGGLRKRGAGETHRAYTVLSDGSNNMRDITWEPIARNLVKWTEDATLRSKDPKTDLDVVNKQTLETELDKVVSKTDDYLVSIEKNEDTKYITVTDSTGLETQFPYEGITDYEELENKPQINGVTLEGNIEDVETLGALRKRGAGETHRAYTVLSNGNNNMRDITWEPVPRNLVKWTDNATLQSENPIADLDVVNKQTFDSSLEAKQDNLVSGTNIKTINGDSILGEGDITVTGEPAAYLKAVTKDTENQTITITDKADNEVTFEYGSGSGGTSDYDSLINKPQIGGVELTGNKSLADIGAIGEAPSDDFQYARRNGEWSRIGEAVKFVTYTYDGEKLMNGDVPLTWDELYEKANNNDYDICINYPDCPFEPAPVRMLGLKNYFLLEGQVSEEVIEFTAYNNNFRSILGADIQVTFRVNHDRFTETTTYSFINKLPSVWSVDSPGLIETITQWITPQQGTSICYVKRTNTELPARMFEVNTNAAENDWVSEIDFSRGLFPQVLSNYQTPIAAGRGMSFRKKKYPISGIKYEKWVRGTFDDIDAGLSVGTEPLRDNGENYLCFSDHTATAIDQNKTDDIVEVAANTAKQVRRFSTIIGSVTGAETVISNHLPCQRVQLVTAVTCNLQLDNNSWITLPYINGESFARVEINDKGICLETSEDLLIHQGFLNVEYCDLLDDTISPEV